MARIYRKKKSNRGTYILFTLILLLVLLIMAVAAFFNVSEITVTGNSAYTAEELIETSGIEIGQNMVLLQTGQIESNLKSKYNYVSEVRVHRSLPDKVCLEIIEEYPVAWIQLGQTYWLVDKNCRLVETGEKEDVKDLIQIRGIEISNPVQGQTMENEEDSSKVRYLSSMLKAASQQEMTSDIVWMDVSNAGNLLMQYGKLYRVELSGGMGMETKFSLLKEVLGKLEGSTRGTIAFTGDNEAHFIPD